MQLVAYGAQDIYLTGNPQITFFKVVYRRHTNFSMEAIQQTFNGNVGATASTVTATISRNGDLVGELWLDVKLATQTNFTAGTAAYVNWVNNTGHAFVKQCEVEIGGQMIDRHYSQWLDVWNELTDHDESEWLGLNKHAAQVTYMQSNAVTTGDVQLYVPLKFWFCRNPGLALPLIALQYHEVKVKLTTRGMMELVGFSSNTSTSLGTPVAPSNCVLWANYIYLDTDERRRFAQVSHEYLIEQVQRQQATLSTSMKLNFNHPVKELIWVNQDTTASTGNTTTTANNDVDVVLNYDLGVGGTSPTENNDYFNYFSGAGGRQESLGSKISREAFTTAKLQLNGHDRFALQNATYFRTVTPRQAGHKIPSKHIYVYSFALKPEEHQPSGTCNFSRIDNSKLLFTATATVGSYQTTVYAINYNVLRIMSGMGGLAYSN